MTGGGARDRSVKKWAAQTMSLTGSHETGSQVTGALFSPNGKEILISTGKPNSRLELLEEKTLNSITTVIESQNRILFLAQSPDGSKVVSGGEGEDLTYWEMFPKSNEKKLNGESLDKSLESLNEINMKLSLR